MAKSKIKLTSNFKAVKGASDDAINELIRKGTDAMHDTAEARLSKGAAKRGYDLPLDVEKDISDKDGRISYPHFYGRWFEYGTVHIKAMPFIRPGNRAGRKVVREDAPEVFEKWMRRKARVR